MRHRPGLRRVESPRYGKRPEGIMAKDKNAPKRETKKPKKDKGKNASGSKPKK
jgi:hypothetical protein